MEKLENFPPVKWSLIHPRIAAWIVLSAGMIILLAIEARDVGLEIGNWIALIVMTILVAGACIWIVSWEDEDDSQSVEEAATSTDDATTTQATDED